MSIRRILYGVLILILVVGGSISDFAAAGAIVCMYATAIITSGGIKNNIPCIYMTLVIICLWIAALLNGSDIYDTCISCVKLSAFGVPFVVKDDSASSDMIWGTYAAIFITAVASIIIYAVQKILGSLADIRMPSVIGYANTASVLFAVGVYLSAYFVEKNKLIYKYIIIAAIDFIAAVLTFSRLGLICFAASLTVYVLIKYPKLRRYIISVYIIFIAAGVYLLSSGYYRIVLGSTMVSRIDCWKDALSVFIIKPFGIGAGTWKELQYSIQSADYSVFQIHNSFLQIMLDGGIIAIISFAVMIVHIMRNSIKDNTLISCIIMLLLHAFVDMDFYFACILFILGVILRVGYHKRIYRLRCFIYIYAVFALCSCIGVYVFKPVTESSVQKINSEYQEAYLGNDFGSMYELSAKWVQTAPKQQSAYEAYRTVVDKIYSSGNNEDMLNKVWNIYVDDIDITAKNPPIELDNILMIPVKTTAQALGYNIEFDNAQQKMLIEKDGRIIDSVRLQNKIYINENDKLKHKIEDILLVGNRLMIRADKINRYFPVTVYINEDKHELHIQNKM